jgi:hypothetical protein
VECTLTIPESNCLMIVRSGASSGHCFNGRVERIGWSSVAGDLRHVNLHINPKRISIFKEVGLVEGVI